MDDERLREVRDIAAHARVSPEHKVRIVKAWQKLGRRGRHDRRRRERCAALKRADIGAANGPDRHRGEQGSRRHDPDRR